MAAISGKMTVTVAGTAEVLATGRCMSTLMIKALMSNTGIIYVGNDGAGDVASGNGVALAAENYVVLEDVAMFESVIIDASISGNGVSWLMLNV
jgi:hypothetical protein